MAADRLLSLLALPPDACELAPFALPLPPLPGAPVAVLVREGALHPTLLHRTAATLSPPPFAHAHAAPALGDRVRLAPPAGDRGGASLMPGPEGDGSAPARIVAAWARRAELALSQLAAHWRSGGCSGGGLSPERIPPAIAALGQFCVYAPWTYPSLHSAAAGALEALAGATCGDDTSTGASALVSRHTEALLAWCRACCASSASGSGSDPLKALPVRYLVPWVLSHAQAPLSASCVCSALPLCLRLVDAWEASSIWCGLSALCLILQRALPVTITETPFAAGMVAETLSRSGATTSAPSAQATLIHVAGHVTAAALSVLHGRPPAISTAAIARALIGSGGGSSRGTAPTSGAAATMTGDHASSGGVARLFDGPWDAAITSTLRSCALASSPHTLYALLNGGLPPLVLASGPVAARHALKIMPLLTRGACDTVDARLAVAALHTLRCTVHACPSCFTEPAGGGNVPTAGEGVGDYAPSAASPLLHDAVALCVQAAMQAQQGQYRWPVEDDTGQLGFPSREGVREEEGGLLPASPAGVQVLLHARACLAELPADGARVVFALLRGDSGAMAEPALQRALDALSAQS